MPGYSEPDAGLDMGDSAITETVGWGGFVLGGAPGILSLVGGTPEEALKYSRQMRRITVGSHPTYRMPALGFRRHIAGHRHPPGRSDQHYTDHRHRHRPQEPGHPKIGAGLVRAPLECFQKALKAFGTAARLRPPAPGCRMHDSPTRGRYWNENGDRASLPSPAHAHPSGTDNRHPGADEGRASSWPGRPRRWAPSMPCSSRSTGTSTGTLSGTPWPTRRRSRRSSPVATTSTGSTSCTTGRPPRRASSGCSASSSSRRGPRTAIFIFFAGHGHLDQMSDYGVLDPGRRRGGQVRAGQLAAQRPDPRVHLQDEGAPHRADVRLVLLGGHPQPEPGNHTRDHQRVFPQRLLARFPAGAHLGRIGIGPRRLRVRARAEDGPRGQHGSPDRPAHAVRPGPARDAQDDAPVR